MKKSSKIAVIVVLVLIAVVAGAIYYLSSNVDRIAAGLIEKHGSAATGTPVRVGTVAIDLRAATGTISGLSVANPEGFTEEAAIEFGDFNLGLDAKSLFSDPVVVQNIAADDAVLRIEQLGARSNLQVLLDNLRSNTAGEPAERGPGPRVVIQRFALSGANVSLSVPGLDEQRTVEVPDVVLTGIGQKSGGVTGAELAREILEPLLSEALQSSAAQGVKEKVREKLGEKAGELADGLLDRLGGERKEENTGGEHEQ
jgi:uncharacterized protein involved in outer membrane biogenesis